jgi:hypothetical protein
MRVLTTAALTCESERVKFPREDAVADVRMQKTRCLFQLGLKKIHRWLQVRRKRIAPIKTLLNLWGKLA